MSRRVVLGVSRRMPSDTSRLRCSGVRQHQRREVVAHARSLRVRARSYPDATHVRAAGAERDPDGAARTARTRPWATAASTACKVAGITYRQLDYWARTGLVVPSVRDASGSGTQRLYSFRDIVVLKVVKRLLDAGVSLQNIRKAIETLRQWGEDDLATMTLDLRRHHGVRVPLGRGGRRPAPGRPGRLRHRDRRRVQGDPGFAGRPAAATGGTVEETPVRPTWTTTPTEFDELAARRARRRAG